MPLIPATGFAGPPMLDEPMPGRAKLVPFIIPRLSAEGLAIRFAFDDGRQGVLPVLARPPLAFAPKPVVGVVGLCMRPGRSCSRPPPCAMPSSWTTGKPMASRVTPPALSCAGSPRPKDRPSERPGFGIAFPQLVSFPQPPRLHGHARVDRVGVLAASRGIFASRRAGAIRVRGQSRTAAVTGGLLGKAG